MVNLAILGSQENLEEVLLPCIVIDVDRAEGPWPSGLLLRHSVDLVDMVVLPVAVEEFVLSQKDAMHSLTIHKHLFDVLSLNDIFVDQRRLGALQLVEICPSNNLISAGKGPKLAVLKVDMLQAGVLKIGEGEWHELKCVLQCNLVLLESKHVV